MDQVCLNTQRHRKTKALALFSLVLALAIMFVVFAEVPVFASTVLLVDNDDAQGHSNYSYGFGSHLNESGCYYGDARTQSTGTPSSGYSYYFYRYVYNTNSIVHRVGQFTADLEVYLNSNNFTDPAAKYYLHYNGDSSGTVIVKRVSGANYVNQNTAPAGWYPYFATTTLGMLSPVLNYYADYVELRSSGSTGYTTGADAVYVTYN